MDANAKLETVKALVGNDVTDETINIYLKFAEQKILSRMYPWKDTTTLKVPSKYDQIHIELTTRYIFRRGIEGQGHSSENGVTRIYKTVNDDDLLAEVMQVVGTL